MAPDIFRARARRRVGAASLAVAALTGTFVAATAATAGAAGADVLAGTTPAWATVSADRGSIAPATEVSSTVYLAGKDQAGLAAYAQAVSTPGNALYHEFLSPSQFQARFGSTSAQVSAVESWLRSAGLKVVSADGHEIQVSGTATQSQSAYGAALHDYSVKGKTYYAPSANVQVPASLSGDVLTVGGLSDMPLLLQPSSLISTSQAEAQVTGEQPAMTKQADGAYYIGQQPCSAYYGQIKDTSAPAQSGTKNNPYAICGYVPSQMRSAYGVTAGVSGKGVTVAIVDAYGSPDILSDANTYAKNHGDPAFKPGQFLDTETPSQWTDESPTECGGPAAWAPEEHIDVEAVHAMAPGATVHYYGGNSCQNADLLAPLQKIVDTHSADIVSSSWGSVVYSSTGNLDQADEDSYNQVLLQAAVEGIEMNFSTGDCGAELPTTGCGVTDTSTEPQADWPSSDPWATAVGGTSVAIGKQGNVEWSTYWGTEIYLPPASGSKAWTDLEWWGGAGGGTSALFAQPWYQQRIVPKSVATTLPTGARTTSAMRVSPDVSLDADPYTGFLVGQVQTLPDGSTGYGESAWGGTSLASPLFAGLQADAMQLQHYQPIGFANPAIYARYGGPTYDDVTATGAGDKAFNDMPDGSGTGATEYSVDFGDSQILAATRGYDDATGVGTPNPLYLWSHLIW